MDFCHVAKRNGGRMPAKGKCAPDKSCGQARSRHVSPGRVMGNDVADKQNGEQIRWRQVASVKAQLTADWREMKK